MKFCGPSFLGLSVSGALVSAVRTMRHASERDEVRVHFDPVPVPGIASNVVLVTGCWEGARWPDRNGLTVVPVWGDLGLHFCTSHIIQSIARRDCPGVGEGIWLGARLAFDCREKHDSLAVRLVLLSAGMLFKGLISDKGKCHEHSPPSTVIFGRFSR